MKKLKGIVLLIDVCDKKKRLGKEKVEYVDVESFAVAVKRYMIPVENYTYRTK